MLPAQQPALAWLAEPPARPRSAVLALLALPPVPDPGGASAPGADAATAEERVADTAAEVVVPAGSLPRRAPARPGPVVPGPRAPVLDRAWSRDQGTLQRIIVGLRAL